MAAVASLTAWPWTAERPQRVSQNNARQAERGAWPTPFNAIFTGRTLLNRLDNCALMYLMSNK